jgi:hypothetical protein
MHVGRILARVRAAKGGQGGVKGAKGYDVELLPRVPSALQIGRQQPGLSSIGP